MTKKRVLFISLVTAMLSFTSIHVYADDEEIDLQVEIIDPDFGNEGQQKGPVLVPSISIEGHTLYFATSCDGCTLRLLDENDVVVYSTIIPTGTTSLVLPSYLSGEYEIQIIQGNIYFWGYIYLL